MFDIRPVNRANLINCKVLFDLPSIDVLKIRDRDSERSKYKSRGQTMKRQIERVLVLRNLGSLAQCKRSL